MQHERLPVITTDRKILITSITVRDPQSNVTPSVNRVDIKREKKKQQASRNENGRDI
jgi:hypothetical protein